MKFKDWFELNEGDEERKKITIQKIIADTERAMERNKVKGSPKILKYKTYKTGEMIGIGKDKVNEYYYYDGLTMYGPFTTCAGAERFRDIVQDNLKAHHQAMVNSWNKEGERFLKPSQR